MIKSIRLQHIQSHKDTTIEFPPGVTVIKGKSHQGKSAIMKGLRATLTNVPTIDTFRSHFAGKKATVSTLIDFDDCTVERTKVGNTNKYVISDADDSEELVAMKRSEVPEEVALCTLMDEVNLQAQFDRFYLLQQPPGEVARNLSEAANLDIIRRSVHDANTIVNSTKGERDKHQAELVALGKKIEAADYLTPAGKLIGTIDDLLATKARVATRKEELIQTARLVRHIESRIVEHEKVLRLEPDVQTIKDLIVKRTKVATKHNSLIDQCENIELLENRISGNTHFLAAESEVNELKALFDKAKEIRVKRSGLKRTCDSIRQLEKSCGFATERISSLDSELTELRKRQMREAETCPTCGALRKDWQTETPVIGRT